MTNLSIHHLYNVLKNCGFNVAASHAFDGESITKIYLLEYGIWIIKGPDSPVRQLYSIYGYGNGVSFCTDTSDILDAIQSMQFNPVGVILNKIAQRKKPSNLYTVLEGIVLLYGPLEICGSCKENIIVIIDRDRRRGSTNEKMTMNANNPNAFDIIMKELKKRDTARIFS